MFNYDNDFYKQFNERNKYLSIINYDVFFRLKKFYT